MRVTCRVRPGPPQDAVRAFRHGPRLERAHRIAANAVRFGSDAFHAAVALDLVVPLAGRRWHALCIWCLERYDVPVEYMHRVGGWCTSCAYNGPDVLVTSVEVSPPATPASSQDCRGFTLPAEV